MLGWGDESSNSAMKRLTPDSLIDMIFVNGIHAEGYTWLYVAAVKRSLNGD